MPMTRADFLQQKKEARATMEQLAKLFPGAFDKHGRPIVASAHFPMLPKQEPPCPKT